MIIKVFYRFHRFFISNLTLSVLWQYLVYEALPSTAVNETSLSQVDGELWHRSLSICFFCHWHKVEHIQNHQLFGGRRGREVIVSANSVAESKLRDPGFESRAPPVERHRDLYTRIVRVACNGQQYGVVNTYMLATCLTTCSQYQV